MKFLVPVLLFLTSDLLALTNTGITQKPLGVYKILIIADEKSTTSALEYQKYLLTKNPFNRLRPEDFVIEIKTAPSDSMACGNNVDTNSRVIQCNTEYLRTLRRVSKADIAVAFTSNASGGSGGEIPVATADFSKYPISTMFHEMLHSYGFDDEYEYQTEAERESYCRPKKSINAAIFEDVPPYSNDASARVRHSFDVPWMGEIPGDVKITTGTNLGTSQIPGNFRGQQVAGLFAGGACSKWKKSWRPYQNSIMRSFADGKVYPLYEAVILERIKDSIGRDPVLRESAENCPPTTVVSPAAQSLGSEGLRISESLDGHNH